MKYFVNYNTGTGNFEFEGTLDEAKEAAEKRIAYTQMPITISADGDDTWNVVSILPWHGVSPDEDDKVTERYGDFGFYGAWIDT